MFWNNKKKNSGNDWALILNPLKTDVEKAEVVEKLIEFFPFSMEEASQLVERTPIVLFDNLSEALSSELEDFFKKKGIQVVISNDSKIKKGCFQVEWPTPPNFKFLNVTPQENLRPPAVVFAEDLTVKKNSPLQSPVTATEKESVKPKKAASDMIEALYRDLEKSKKTPEMPSPLMPEIRKVEMPPVASKSAAEIAKVDPDIEALYRELNINLPSEPKIETVTNETIVDIPKEALGETLDQINQWGGSFTPPKTQEPVVAPKEALKNPEPTASGSQELVLPTAKPLEKMVKPKPAEIKKPAIAPLAKAVPEIAAPKKKKGEVKEKTEVSAVESKASVFAEPKSSRDIMSEMENKKAMPEIIPDKENILEKKEEVPLASGNLSIAPDIVTEQKKEKKIRSDFEDLPSIDLPQSPSNEGDLEEASQKVLDLLSKMDALSKENQTLRYENNRLKKEAVSPEELTEKDIRLERQGNEIERLKLEVLSREEQKELSGLEYEKKITSLKEAVAGLQTEVENFHQEKELLKRQMMEALQAKENQIEEGRQSLAEKERILKEKESLLSQIAMENDQLTDKVEQLTTKLKQVLIINKELTQLQEQSSLAMEEEIQKHKSRFNQELSVKDKEIQDLHEKIYLVQKQLEASGEEKQRAAKEVEQLRDQIKNLTQERERLNLIQKRAEFQATIRETEEQLKGLEENCKLFNESIDEKRKAVDDLLKKKQEIEARLADVKQKEKHVLETLTKRDKVRTGKRDDLEV